LGLVRTPSDATLEGLDFGIGCEQTGALPEGAVEVIVPGPLAGNEPTAVAEYTV
jgi:hypothetical protein